MSEDLLRNYRVLLVDDDPVILKNMKAALDGVGLGADLASDGAEAWFLSRNNDYDVVVTDLLMPEMNGSEFINHLVELDRIPAIIVITGHASIDVTIECLKKGVKDFIRKPFTMDELVESIRVVLKKREVDRQLSPDWKKVSTKYGLTERQLTVLRELYSTGMDTYGLASKIGISYHTVRSHINVLLSKLGVSSRLELMNKLREMH